MIKKKKIPQMDEDSSMFQWKRKESEEWKKKSCACVYLLSARTYR